MEVTKIIPRYANSEIKFILYNFNNIDKLIDKRKKDLIDTTMNFSNDSWIKSIHGNTNTQENIILEFDEDYKIIKLNKWNKVIKEFIKELQNCKNKIYFLVFKYKYIYGLKEEEISKKLNISLYKFKKIDFILKRNLYEIGIKNNIFERRD